MSQNKTKQNRILLSSKVRLFYTSDFVRYMLFTINVSCIIIYSFIYIFQAIYIYFMYNNIFIYMYLPGNIYIFT